MSVVFDGAEINLDSATPGQRVTLGGTEGRVQAITAPDRKPVTIRRHEDRRTVVGRVLLVEWLALVWLLFVHDDKPTDANNGAPATVVEAVAGTVGNDDLRTSVKLAVAGHRVSLGPRRRTVNLGRRVNGDCRDRLAAVLDAYGRVTFAGDDLDGDRARRAIEAAREIVEKDS